MFSKDDIDYLRYAKKQFVIYQINGHDATIHSTVTGHDWIIISNYESESCIIFHRHSQSYPYHRQKGNYRSLREALVYITDHEEWFASNKLNNN